MRRGVCLKCGSPDLLTDTPVALSDGSRVQVQRHVPEGWLGTTKPVHAEVRAWVCRRCGYTELYTRGVGTLPSEMKPEGTGI